jgi:Superinfection immunity protein
MDTETVGGVILLLLAGLYILPTLVAWDRGHRQAPAITVLNLLAGWTLVGWLIAMVWSCTRPANGTTQAPYETSHH